MTLLPRRNANLYEAHRATTRMNLFGLTIKTSYIIWGIVILSLAGLFFYAANSPTDSVEGIECSPMEYATFHIHARLEIYANGEQIAVPSNVGVFSGCLYWLHTHSGDGLIHIEAPTKRDFTLGQFFDIWNKTYGDPLKGLDVSALNITVNGKQYAGDYRDLVFASHQNILMQFGEPYVEQEEYIFPPGL